MDRYDITINPVKSALRAQESFRRMHRKKPAILLCSPESYRNLVQAAGVELISTDGVRCVFNESELRVDSDTIDYEGYDPEVNSRRWGS